MLGFLLVCHGLAHSSALIWATGVAPAWLSSLLWTIAIIGYVTAGLGILESRVFRTRWPWLLTAATVASLILLAFAGATTAAVGIFLDLVLVAAVAHWIPRNAARRKPETGLRRHRIAAAFGLAFTAYATVVVLGRPFYATWGTTPAERASALYGDDPSVVARYRFDHGVTIHAPADSVWPWLVQLGQDRGGFYSYDWLERLFGDNVHNANAIRPEWQRLDAGGFVRAAPPTYLGGRFGELGWRVSSVVPGRALVLENWGAFVLRPVDSATTRFFVRTRGDGTATLASVVLGPINILVFEPAHFIMQRRMMLGIRERAERMMRT